jgi:hypothetical protein
MLKYNIVITELERIWEETAVSKFKVLFQNLAGEHEEIHEKS